MNTQRLNLDLTKRTGNQQVTIAQGDAAGTTIVATVYDGGTKLAETGIEAFFVMELPDRRHYMRDGAEYDGGVITYVVDESHAATVEGYTDNAYFELRKGADVASTERFAVIVEPCAYADHEPAEDWDNAIFALIEAGTKAATDADETVSKANETIRKAEAAAETATTEAGKARAATESANKAASEASKAAGDANVAKTSADNAATAAHAAAGDARTATARAEDAAKMAEEAATGYVVGRGLTEEDGRLCVLEMGTADVHDAVLAAFADTKEETEE